MNSLHFRPKLDPNDVFYDIRRSCCVNNYLMNKSYNNVTNIIGYFNKLGIEEKNSFFSDAVALVKKKTFDAIRESFLANNGSESSEAKIPQIKYRFKSLPTIIQIKLLTILKDSIVPCNQSYFNSLRPGEVAMPDRLQSVEDIEEIPRESDIVDEDKLNRAISFINEGLSSGWVQGKCSISLDEYISRSSFKSYYDSCRYIGLAVDKFRRSYYIEEVRGKSRIRDPFGDTDDFYENTLKALVVSRK